MKKGIQFICVCMMLFCLFGCKGNVKTVGIQQWEPSLLYSDREIEAAIDVILHEFKWNWDGCTLKEITYAGDSKSLDYQDWAERNHADDVIVLISSFDVDSTGGDGSLNPDSTYRNWMWILVRNGNGKWKHVDHGY